MQSPKPLWLSGPLVLVGMSAATTAQAAGISVKVEIPRLTVSEYHRPYVAMWIEGANLAKPVDLAVWYDVKMKDNGGAKWLSDMRLWWRKSGRNLQMPVDGVSGATRAPGTHEVRFTEGSAPLTKLPAGKYEFVIEATRELGGREYLRIPFQWPPQGQQPQPAKGASELGAVSLTLKK
ncbi:DUF2271 domain-containing protein [Pedomonas mirosovicensis]|uniref:DUF2271 domain-containing protein n=1 Tax=Pedomonas mirosovicensis TaxID=2908641 RepID=UPI002168BFF5|nr:DUF2271 domain-containing protein [Pedomonas mirosovicensis]MCH8686325.1 DUF2271 domain-containing protein [Pedomonas mirosovicensis]